MEWIKFEDKKPNEKEEILACLGENMYGNKMEYIQLGKYCSNWNPNGYFYPDYNDGQVCYRPKYWMKLPQLPKDK